MLSNRISSHRPLCFVLTPFGKKQDIAGSVIDFDSAICHIFIGPSVKQSGFEPIRADEEMTGGIIHKPMLEPFPITRCVFEGQPIAILRCRL